MTKPFAFRDENGNLQLDKALGERYVRHYTDILSSSDDKFAAMQLAMSVQVDAPEHGAPAYSWAEPRRGRETEDGWWLSPEGAPDRAASSCTALAVIPEVCWDVCGYYRSLGVHWKATKREIARAQLEMDPGRNDPAMSGVAYAVSQLLDPVIRRAYDRQPLGGLFLGDRDVRSMIERAAALKAARHNAEAWAVDPDGYAELATDQGKVLDGWGFNKDGVSDAEARERLAGGGFQPGSSSDALGGTLSGWGRQWGWYRLVDPYDEDPWEDVPEKVLAERLEAWQGMVAAAFSALGERAEFAVGIWPGRAVKVWRDSKEGCIIFFTGTSRPTQWQARLAVDEAMASAGSSRGNGSSRSSRRSNR